MAETPEEIFERSKDSLRMPSVQDWETFPFDGQMKPRVLAPPLAQEAPRSGENGTDCHACTASDDKFLWTNERWRLSTMREPHGLPVIVLLQPREHYAEPGDLPADLAADCGVMLSRVERAIRAVDHVGRVHVCRWGDGSEHLHWWFLARPARLPQLRGSFAAIWDDVLPPTPEDVWKSNLETVIEALSSSCGPT